MGEAVTELKTRYVINIINISKRKFIIRQNNHDMHQQSQDPAGRYLQETGHPCLESELK